MENSKGRIDNNLNIEGMIVDFSDVAKQITELVNKASNNQNYETLVSFIDYCNKNPELRFWQALRSWAGVRFILFSEAPPKSKQRDTFYFTGRNS